jgi:hypothetical protein
MENVQFPASSNRYKTTDFYRTGGSVFTARNAC